MSELSARRAAGFAVAVGLLASFGCGSNDEIRTYQVAKPTDKTAPVVVQAEPAPDGPAKVRLLGAVIPVKEVSWFVKFTGPIEQIDANEKAFDEFLNSIKVTDDPRKPPEYKAPAGWKELPARQMRLATFAVSEAPDAPQVYISTPFGGSLLENVNRWRGEVGAKPVTAAELPTATKELMLGATKAYRVDARGPGGKGGMMRPPMMGGK
jgi:hypothetical protein